MENLDSLFSFTAADALAETESKKKSFSNEGVYKPSIKDEKCVDQNYKSLVRFVPFIHDGKVRTTIERWECFLKDVNGNNGVFVVSPKTDGKKCPMREMSYKLYKSDYAVDKENSKKINVYQQWYAIVEVVKDTQHPEYEGKHLIYQFGAKIYQKIELALKGSEYKDPINPFDFFNARLFEINLTKDNKKMDNGREVMNYDNCGFIEKTAPIHFTDKDGNTMTLDTDAESKKAFIEWLKTDSVVSKIDDYFFKEWDAETTEKVNTNLASYTSGYTAPKSTVAKAKDIINDIESNNDETPVKVSKPKPEPVNEEVVDDTESVSTEDDDWVDSILNS